SFAGRFLIFSTTLTSASQAEPRRWAAQRLGSSPTRDLPPVTPAHRGKCNSPSSSNSEGWSRVGTHASGVLSRERSTFTARQRRAYHPSAIAPGTDLVPTECLTVFSGGAYSLCVQ